MKQKIFFYALILCFILLSKSLLSNYIQKENYKAYLTVSFQNPNIFADSTSQRAIESKIEKVFENEGINIIHIEKPEEYKLYINVIIRDSLIIGSKQYKRR